MNIKLKPMILPITVLSLSILITWLLILTKEDTKKEVTVKSPLTIEAFKVKAQDHRIYLESDSEIIPRKQLTITSSVPGEILYVSDFLDNGLVFKKGDLLIQIDSLDYSIARINAKASLDAAYLDFKMKEADAKRSQEELEAYGTSKPSELAMKTPQLKSSKSLLDAAKANYKKTVSDLAKTSIYAPFNGRVEINSLEKGMKVSTFDKLARIYSVDSYKAEFPISISDLEYLEISKSELGFINIPNLKIDIEYRVGGKTYLDTGQFLGISGSVDKLTQTVNLKVLLDGDILSLPIDKGVYVKAKIYGKKYEEVFLIPNKSINDKNEIYVSEENILIKKKVEIIKRYKDTTVVNFGLKNNDIVNITPISIYVDSMKVDVINK